MNLKTKHHFPYQFCFLVFFYLLLFVTQQQCLTYHEYYDSTQGMCLPCQYNCLTCLDNTMCAVCASEFYLDDNSGQCNKCPFGCKTCSDSVTCITCNTGMYIDASGNCIPCSTGVSSCSIAVIEKCHDQYFLLGGICAGCLDNCKTCEDFVTCTQCMTGYYLRADRQLCISCSTNCQICVDSSTCTSCAKGYKIDNNVCIVQDCSSFGFCIKCSSFQCLSCQQGKYLAANNTCIQGASILCEESTGPHFTNCQVDDYGCPSYALVQQDPLTYQEVSVCSPFSATQYAQYIYGVYGQSNCGTGTCGNAYTQLFSVNTRKSFYQLEYHLNVRLYKNPSHTINITILNKTTQAPVSSNIHTKSVALQISTFAQSEPACSSCPYGQVYLTGILKSNGYQQTKFLISDQNGAFTIVEYVFKFFTCTIDKCETCTTVSDCTLCVQPYLLQLVKCVEQCDAGFYKYQRFCMLECPSDTFSIQSSYECQGCISPCKTCSSQTKCMSCVNGYFLQGSGCVQICSSNQTFGNTTSNECETCPNPCSTCQAVNSTFVKCTSCMIGYLYIAQKCVFNCPVKLYNTFHNNISQCATCDTSCSDCYISSTTCSACVAGYLLYATFCNQTAFCAQGYFIGYDNVCLPCHFPCATCFGVSNNCTSCLKGAFHQNQCMTLCPDGLYTDGNQVSNITCKDCTNNCLTCLSATLCLSCSSGKYLYDTQCLTACPNSTYYPNALNNTCTECPPPCKQCTSATSCLSCSTGYLDGNACTLFCNSSSFINANFECQMCISPCIECYSASQCVKCQLPNILYTSGCITTGDCQNLGKYVAYTKNETTNALAYGECRQCTFPCATCQTSSIYCLSCAANYLYLSDLKTCVQSCPSSYFPSTNKCLKCSASCYQCSLTSTNCTSCSSGKYLDALTNTCVSTCPDGYYADNELGKCVVCVLPCNTCYNIYFCKSCAVGIFYNKVCVDNCPAGTILNSTLNECLFCTDNCLTCVGVTSKCLTCVSGYFLIAQNNTCATTCPSASYADSFAQACQNCISPCATCTGATQCVTCVANYYLSGKNCLASCPAKYFKNSATMTCDPCNSTICQTCVLNANNCLTCAVGYFYDSVSSSCVPVCPSGYYPQTLARSCKNCQFPCQSCANTSYCTQCQSAYKLYLNRCYSSCPIGFFSTSANTCQQCTTNCQICNSQTNCTKCASAYYVQNGNCVLICPQGLYKGKQDMTNYDYCLACPSNCQICQDFNTCNLCANGFYLFNGLCLTECPILHYTDTATVSCKSCPQNCISCVNATFCNKCINSYMYQNQCYMSCPSQTYIFNQQQCKNCVSPCVECESQFTCITCAPGFFYYHSYCVTSCPQGVWLYPHNGSCAETCPYNKYEEKFVCYIDGCGGKLVEMNGYCLNNCPTKYYVSKNESCVVCSSNPEICERLFVADLKVLRSQQLTLVLYFSEQADLLQSIADVNITFADENNMIKNLSLKSYEFTQFKLKFVYDYQKISFITAYVTIPYLDSQQSNQAISVNFYQQIIYYFNNYENDKESATNTLASYLPLVMTAGLFLTIVLNIIAKNSHYLQLLDFMQLIGACVYLDMQYPLSLENFLHRMGYVLFLFMPKLVNHTPFAFSSPKYIFYNTDTSFARAHLLTFLLFITLFIAMVVVILVNKYWKKLAALTDRIKYRNLNDLFSILSFPLLLFSFSFFNAIPFDLFLGFAAIFITAGWIVFISNLIISAQEMGELRGLLSDYEAVESKLGLMYTPFSYIRRLIVALVFCIFPERPLAALTLLLIFTILILICLFFYQPFESQITDYVSMYLEFTLILFILLIVIIGLDVLEEDGNRILGIIGIVFVSLAMAVGLGWLVYLTVKGLKQFYENYGKNSQVDTEDCIKDDKKKKDNSEHSQSDKKHQFNHHEGQNQDSASNLVNETRQGKNKYIMEDMESISQNNSNKEEFKHWHDDDQSQSGGSQKMPNEEKRPPEMLMKKVLKEKYPDMAEANEHID